MWRMSSISGLKLQNIHNTRILFHKKLHEQNEILNVNLNYLTVSQISKILPGISLTNGTAATK